MLKSFLFFTSYIPITLLFHLSSIYASQDQREVDISIDNLESFLGAKEKGIILKKGILKEIAPNSLDLEFEKDGKSYALKELLPVEQPLDLFGHHFSLLFCCVSWELRDNYKKPNPNFWHTIDPYRFGLYNIPCLEENSIHEYALMLCLYGRVGINYPHNNTLYEIQSKVVSQHCLKLTFEQIRDYEVIPFIQSIVYDELSGLKFKWGADLYPKEGTQVEPDE